MDAIIPKGELLLEKSVFYIKNENSYYLAKWKKNSKTILFKINKCRNYYPYIKTRNTGLSDLFNNLNEIELSVSIYLDYQSILDWGYSSDDCYKQFQNYIINIAENINDKHVYQIYLKPEYNDPDSLFHIKGSDLKDLLEFRSKNKGDGYFLGFTSGLSESIVYNDAIPYEFKSRIMGGYISSFFMNNKVNELNKKKYLDFLIKMVTDIPYKTYTTFEYGNEMDQHAVLCAEGEYDKKNIDASDLIGFCDRVIAVSKNPRTILQAFAAKTQCYLDLDDLDTAQELAIKALNMYEEKYTKLYDGLLNAKAAKLCLNFLLKSGLDPAITNKHFEVFKKNVSLHPEFKNYLLYIKAMQTDLTACPVAEAIAAYKRINLDPEIEYSFSNKAEYNPFYSVKKAAKDIIKQLEEEFEEKVTIDKPFIAKKYIMAKELQIMNESGKMDVTIIQHSLPLDERQLIDSNAHLWQKAIIDGEIYWIQIENK
jgi:hypothetical protein